ncbi:hypothetical protein DDZ14_16460 [Maritimibacter sp. 55A14]|uniref:peptidoglycan-binding domain-containing protein n=1 Tax=Maritimibacter sp. 55A14 TaxID=2174844 RepID=UPI000D60BC99|nr:peptidoglycan-binding protein [Maritimibacter sp. 55A14]PWE29924.1 hypothetical protein DDZ14_16460 [Maritimibacter sp. 55A14]
MRLEFTTAAAALLVALAPGIALANSALVVGNDAYAEAPRMPDAADALDAVPALEDAEFTVISGANLDADTLRARLNRLLEREDGSGPAVVLLSGRFARAAHDSWFLGTGADAPGLARVGAEGLSLETVMEIAARTPGRAVILLGHDDTEFEPGEGLEPGIGRLDIPQGVTVIRGPADRIARFAAEELTVRGRSLAVALESQDRLTAEGFLAAETDFLPEPDGDRTGDAELERNATQAGFWSAAQAVDTEDAYNAYLDRYPDGRFAADARNRIQEMRDAPRREAQQAERGLQLSRATRHAIQENLVELGYDTRGTEGVFGAGTRGAIQAWQSANGEEPTSYLTADQIARIEAQADRRRAEAEDEQRARREREEQQERAYWEETGKKGDAAGLRAYLERYPDGLFSGVAEGRLDEIEAREGTGFDREERGLWREVRRENTAEAYRRYLDRYPDGAFALQAETRLAELDPDGSDGTAARSPEEVERAMGLSKTSRTLIERRLAALGYQPGQVDGEFTGRTRDAIRRYQERNGLEITGYVSAALTSRMLAGAAAGIFNE